MCYDNKVGTMSSNCTKNDKEERSGPIQGQFEFLSFGSISWEKSITPFKLKYYTGCCH